MKLYKHQQKLLDLNPKRFLLAWEVGTGKTFAAISLVKKNNLNPMIIVPKSLKEQWEEQVPEDWCVITKETFRRDWNKLPKYNCIVIDEAHYFSGVSSQMHKNLIKYLEKWDPEYIYGLTATPYMSTPWNIYALAKIFGYNWSYIAYKRKFFYEVQMGHRKIPMVKRGIEKEIAELVSSLGNTVRMDECVDIPEQVYETEYFELTPDQKKAIDNLDDIQAIVRWTKVHQICGGTLKGDNYTEDKHFKCEKTQRLLDLCKEHKKIIVVCRYNNEIKFLSTRIPSDKKIFIINGNTPDRHQVVSEANSCANAVVLIQGACSEGYELPSYPLMVFYSYDFSLKNYIQIKGRIQRINNIKKNVYLSLLVKGTIDEDVYRSLERKQDFDVEIYDR